MDACCAAAGREVSHRRNVLAAAAADVTPKAPVKIDAACHVRLHAAHAAGRAGGDVPAGRAGEAAEGRGRRGGGGAGAIEDACCGRWFSRLSRSLLVGRKPLSARELAELKAEGVSSVLSVIEPHEFAVAPSTLRQEGFQHLAIPVREGSPLTIQQLWQGINFMRSAMARAGEKAVVGGGGGGGGGGRG